MTNLTAPLHAWQQVVEKASPAPWKAETWFNNDGGFAAVGPHHEPKNDEEADSDVPDGPSDSRAKADAEFIALARTALPLLIQKCLQMQGALKLAQQALRREVHSSDCDPMSGMEVVVCGCDTKAEAEALAACTAALAPFDETPPQVER